jgi:hypothetical protein
MSDFEHEQPVKETEWISGLALWILMLPLCCTFFLVMLDISIIATVSKYTLANPTTLLTNKRRQSLRSQMSFAHCQMWDGTERLINWPAVHCSH